MRLQVLSLLLLLILFPPCASGLCATDATQLVDGCCAEIRTGYDYDNNPQACLTTNASACGGAVRGRCVTFADAYTEAGWSRDPTTSNATCWFLMHQEFHVANDENDGLCRCNEGYDRLDCRLCTVGYKSDGNGGCVKRAAPLNRRNVRTMDGEAAAKLSTAFSDERVTGDTVFAYSHNNIGPFGTARNSNIGEKCPHAPFDPHAGGMFLLWHRNFFSLYDQNLAEFGYTQEPEGLPYMNMTADDIGETLFAFEPALSYNNTCPMLPFSAMFKNPGILLNESAIIETSDFVEFASHIAVMHSAALCWFYQLGMMEASFCSHSTDGHTWQQMNSYTHEVAYKLIDYDDEGDLRKNAGYPCATVEGSDVREGQVPYGLHGVNGDDAPGVFFFHAYLDALLEKWGQKHGREKACFANSDDLRLDTTDHPDWKWHPDQCLAYSMLNSFNLSYRESCMDPSIYFGLTYDFDSWDQPSSYFENAVVYTRESAAASPNIYHDIYHSWWATLGVVLVGALLAVMARCCCVMSAVPGTMRSQLSAKELPMHNDGRYVMSGYDLSSNDAANAAAGGVSPPSYPDGSTPGV